MPEPSAWGSLNVALLLGALGWPQQNILIFLLFSPFILFRLFSRLWLEVDLESGEVYFYRTFFGLQVCSDGLDLRRAEHILSGRQEELPGQPISYSVQLRLQGNQELLLHLALEREDCHRWGRALARRLDLPHYCQEDEASPPAYPEQTWTRLDSKLAPTGNRAALPWGPA